MIPMTYKLLRETFRFAWRNEPFPFADFGFRCGSKQNGPVGLLACAPQIGGARIEVAAKKLRKRAAKSMESLVRVNLCAYRMRSSAPPRAQLSLAKGGVSLLSTKGSFRRQHALVGREAIGRSLANYTNYFNELS